jgi:hypothetical protein
MGLLGYHFNFDREFDFAGRRRHEMERLNFERCRLAEQQRLQEQAETKRQRAAVQTKSHKARSIPTQKVKEVPTFLKNFVNKNQ